ncbi:MAG TPA: hypothetical protein VL282_10285 [Tepidisphaeraceae bacterium]|jgi:hypothetical protein|nr:hypothetical protein [Tepidisphaeraceae bacterium]
MRQSNVLVATLFIVALAGISRAAEPLKVFAEGDWSEPVADGDGYAVRGRLVLCERMVIVGGRSHFPKQGRREVSVHIELENVSEAVGPPLRLFCDLGRTDFRFEHKGGLHTELLDKDKHPVASPPICFGGGAPRSEWVTLPNDGMIRLRTSPFGISREKGLSIMPSLDKLWEIAEDDPNEYFLTGTFTVDPSPEEKTSGSAERVWKGTITLPPVRIVVHPEK